MRFLLSLTFTLFSPIFDEEKLVVQRNEFEDKAA